MNNEVEKYFKILYPEFDKLSQEEKERILIDKDIIEENIDKITAYLQEIKSQEENIESEEKNEVKEELVEEVNKELLVEIITRVKINKYFNILYPNYESLAEEEKIDLVVDKSFIKESIEAIDEYYKDCKSPGCGAVLMELSDQQIIEMALEMFKKQENGFTKDDIEQLTGNLKMKNLREATANIRGTSEEQEILLSNDTVLLEDK